MRLNRLKKARRKMAKHKFGLFNKVLVKDEDGDFDGIIVEIERLSTEKDVYLIYSRKYQCGWFYTEDLLTLISDIDLDYIRDYNKAQEEYDD